MFQDLDTRLKKLTHSAQCMLFMKGTPQEPRCGKMAHYISKFYNQEEGRIAEERENEGRFEAGWYGGGMCQRVKLGRKGREQDGSHGN